ncbi:MAG: SDR family oxidoreductase [Moraxellaceae bacterium]|nr:SDR family oxidoreductase [Moraxellaceae bacterium]
MSTVSAPRLLITGAGSGLGRAMALAWSARGARVLVADIAEAPAQETVALCTAAGAAEAHYLKLDVTHEADFVAAAAWVQAHWSGLDILVNNAGVAGGGTVDGISETDWEWIININLLGVARGCRVFTPLFKQQQAGQFVNIASMAGLLNPPGMASYNVSKAGVVALSETLTSELSPWNIRTLVVCPSYFQTNLDSSLRTHDPAMKAALSKLLTSSDITADDIAAGIVAAVDSHASLYLPHEKARAAWQMKQQHPEAFAAEMQAQARKQAAAKGRS